MRSRPPTLFVASLALAALAGSSCREPDGELVSQRVENRDFVQPGQAFPPQIDEILIADWPPMGPAGVITVEVRDDAGVASVLFEFAETVLFDTQDQRNVTLDVLGIELGEGLGDMVVTATDVDGTWARRTVEGLLVDLSAPEIDLLDTYIPASGPEAVLFAWVSDAWILGDVTLEVGGEVLTYDFPDAYPSTLGQEWDYSLVSFEAGDLPLGSHLALLTVRDAAGNETSQSFDLVVDGTPPVASVAAPSDGEHVSGVFAVQASGADDLGPVSLEVSLGGVLAATAPGPSALVTIDASDFLPGPIELSVVAVDPAGNRSAPAIVSLVIDPPG